MFKAKFLAVAKEKNQLEAVILQQSDMIKKLEKEKNALSKSLDTLTVSYNNMQELLLKDRGGIDPGKLQDSDTSVKPSSQKFQDKKPDVIKEKFLAVAKEKNQIEAVILQQSDVIKNLEKEKNALSQSLERLVDEHKKLKEKLLDFGILRNMEIAELKKMIEQLMAENRKLISEGEPGSHPPENEPAMIATHDGQTTEALLNEKHELEERLKKAHEALTQAEEQKQLGAEVSADRAALALANRELTASVESLKRTIETLQQNVATYESDLARVSGSLASSQEMIQAFEQEEAILRSQLRQTTVERNEAATGLSGARAEIEKLFSDKSRREEELQLRIREHKAEIAGLKDTIEELNSAIEHKFQDSDDLHEKFFHLYEKLSARNIAVREKMPELLEALHALSTALSGKAGDDSLLAKDLFALNLKLSSLIDELNRKDDILREITEKYSKQKQEIAAQLDAYAQARKDMQTEIEDLKQNVEDLSVRASASEEMLAETADDKNKLLQKIREADTRIAELKKENDRFAGDIRSRNRAVEDLQHELARIANDYTRQKEEIAALHTAYGETQKGLLADNEWLKQETELLKSRLSASEEMLVAGGLEKDSLKQKIAEADILIAGIRNENTELTEDVAERSRAAEALQHELAGFREQLVQEEDAYQRQISALQEEMAILKQVVIEKNDLLAGLSAEYSHEKDVLAGLAKTYKDQLSLLERETERLQEESLEGREALAAHQFLLIDAQKEKTLLESQISSLSGQVQKLSAEREDLASLVAGKDQALSKAVGEIRELQSLLEHRQEAFEELEAKMKGEVEIVHLARSEQEALAKSLLEYQEALLHLKDEIVSLNKSIADKEAAIELLTSEKERLLHDISDRQATHEQSLASIHSLESLSSEREDEAVRLKDKIVSLNKSIADKEAAIELLTSEKEHLLHDISDRQATHEQSLASIHSLKTLSAEREREATRLAAEKRDLLNNNEELQKQIERLQQSKDAEIRSLKDDLSAYSRAFADLGVRLDQSIRDNDALRAQTGARQEQGREMPEHFGQGRGTTLPVRISFDTKEKTAPARHAFVYTLLAVILIAGIGFSFYAYNTGLIALLVNRTEPSSQKVEQQADFAYIDMLSLLTRSSSSDTLKFQATLMTDPLVLKSEDPAEASLFNFNNYRYFKITISSPKIILNKNLTKNPYPYITLTSDRVNVQALPEEKVKDIKIFYKKDDPVSVMFYCAFPKNSLDADSASLSLRNEDDQITLSWDLRAIRKHNLIH